MTLADKRKRNWYLFSRTKNNRIARKLLKKLWFHLEVKDDAE